MLAIVPIGGVVLACHAREPASVVPRTAATSPETMSSALVDPRVLACPDSQLPLAVRKTRARAHFKAGMAHIEASNFVEGIAELEMAYCIQPHPVVAYNLGRANRELDRVGPAIAWFRLYLESDPADRAEVEAILRSLEAQRGKPL